MLPELVLLSLVGLFSLIFLLQSGGYGPVAALFPRLIAGATLVLTLYCLQGLIRSGLRRLREEPAVVKGPPAARSALGTSWHVTFGAMLSYLLLTLLVGLGIATAIYLLLSPLLMGFRRPVVLVSVGLGLSVALYLVFSLLLHVPLPGGILLGRW